MQPILFNTNLFYLKVLQASKSKLQAQIQQIIEDHKILQASELKLQAQITEKEDRLNELAGPLLETMPDEILLKILGYLSTSDVLRNVARVSKKLTLLQRRAENSRRMNISIFIFLSYQWYLSKV